jgi:hypothetical protein
VTNEEKVLAIIDAAPRWMLATGTGVHAFFVVHGGHGLPAPASIPAADRVLRKLARDGVLDRVGRNPSRYLRTAAQA